MQNAEYVQGQTTNAALTGFTSRETEEAVITQLLSGSVDVSRYVALLSREDFGDAQLGKIYQAIQAVVAAKMGVDIVTVNDALHRLHATECDALTLRMTKAISAQQYNYWSIEDHVQIVRDLSSRRRAIGVMQTALRRLNDPSENLSAVLEDLRTETSNVVQSRHKWQTTQDVMIKTMTDLQDRLSGKVKAVTTGVSTIDKLIGGFYGGELTVIGARPAVGKSAFGANIALQAARKGFKVCVVSREMSDVQYGQRMLSNLSGVNGMILRKADESELGENELEALTIAMAEASQLPIQFMFTVSTIEDLRSEVQLMSDKGEIDMLIVDYLQLMRSQKNFEKENVRIGYVSKSLKDMAVDFNIPVIALAQVNRDTDGQMPTLKSLKASGDIEQDADGVIFLHKPMNADDEYVYPEDRGAFAAYINQGLTYLCIGIAKQRQGTTGKTCVLFDAAHMRYTAIDREHE